MRPASPPRSPPRSPLRRVPTANRDTDGPYQIELADIEAQPEPTPATTTGSTHTDTQNNDLDTNGLDPDADKPSILCGLSQQASTYAIRLGVTFLAVVLLWVTSLSVANGIVDLAIEGPTTQQVADTWSLVIDFAVDQHDRYLRCVTDQLAVCDNTLNRTLLQIEADVKRAASRNADIVYQNQLVSQSCNSKYLELVYSISNFTTTCPDGNCTIAYKGSCTSAEIQEVKLLLNDVGQVKSQAYVINKQYTRDNAYFSESAVQSARNRSEYDRNYVANKLSFLNGLYVNVGTISGPHIGDIVGSIDLTAPVANFVGCLSISPTGSCSLGISLKDKLQAAQDLLANAYQQALDVAALLRQYAENYRQRVLQVMSGVNTFFDYLRSLSGLLPFSTSVLPNTFIPDLQLVNIPVKIPPIPLAQTWSEVSSYLTSFTNAVAALAGTVNVKALAWQTDLSLTLGPIQSPNAPHFFTDYHPPDVELFAQNQQQEQAANDNEFLTKSAVALAQYDQIPPPKQPDRSFNQSVVFAPNLNFKSQIQLNFEPFRGDVKVTPVLEVFYFVMALFVVADIIWRVTASVRIVVRYLTAKSVVLPVVDCRTARQMQTLDRRPVMVARCLTHPYTIIALLILIGLLCLSAFASVYIPMYDGYMAGCVNSRNGTILTNNSFAVVYNYAASDGDKALARGLSRYDATRGEACGQNLESSNKAYTDNQQALSASMETHGTSTDSVTLINKCVDMGSFPNAVIYRASTGGHQWPPDIIASALTGAGACQTISIQAYTTLENQAFNCSLLPVCQITCNGPSRVTLQSATQRSGCTTEWMAHSAVIRTFILALAFICINLSRYWFMEGIMRYHWRSLTPPTGFTYMGTVSRAGKMTRNMDENVVKKLDVAIARWERVAYLLFFLAVIIHVPYIVVLAVTSGPFAYQS